MSDRGHRAWMRVALFWALSLLLLPVVGTLTAQAPTLVRMGAQTVLGIGVPAWIVTRAVEGVRLGRARPRWMLAAVSGGFGLACLGSAWLMGLDRWLGDHVPGLREGFEHRQQLLRGALRLDEPAWIPVVLVVVAFAPAVCEEWFYRGGLRGLVRSQPRAVRVVGIALLFAMAHMDLFGFVPLVATGCLLGWVRERSAGLMAPIVMHFVLNATGAVLLPRLPPPESAFGVLGLAGLGVALVFSALTMPALLFQSEDPESDSTGRHPTRSTRAQGERSGTRASLEE